MYLKSYQVVGYIYDAALHHPDCVIELLIRKGMASPAARDMDPERVLDQVAAANAINRGDEFSFSSDEFPQVVFVDDVEGTEVCDECLQELL